MSFGSLSGLSRMEVLVIRGRIHPADVSALCERGKVAADRGSAPVVYCDVAGVTRPDAVAVDALARLQLTLKRVGYELCLLRISEELRDLLDLAGLTGAVGAGSCLGVEAVGETEERKHPRGVEEEADPRDGSV